MDSAVVVFQTYDNITGIQEFRVAYVEHLYKLYGDYDADKNEYVGNGDIIKDIFGAVKVYKNLDEALDAAEILSKDYEYLENGVILEPSFHYMKFD